MHVIELIFRAIIFTWFKKKYKKIKESFIAYLYSREIQKRNKIEDGYNFRRKEAHD